MEIDDDSQHKTGGGPTLSEARKSELDLLDVQVKPNIEGHATLIEGVSQDLIDIRVGNIDILQE